jgi:hypothetical protein
MPSEAILAHFGGLSTPRQVPIVDPGAFSCVAIFGFRLLGQAPRETGSSTMQFPLQHRDPVLAHLALRPKHPRRVRAAFEAAAMNRQRKPDLPALPSARFDWGTTMRMLFIILALCAGTLSLNAPLSAQSQGDQQNVLVAATTAIQSILKDKAISERRTILDTLNLDINAFRGVLATATGWSLGHRADVLHCVPPICRLVNADALVLLHRPSFQSDGTAYVFVQFWIPGSETRGAAMTAYRVELSRAATCKPSCSSGWIVKQLTLVAVT